MAASGASSLGRRLLHASLLAKELGSHSNPCSLLPAPHTIAHTALLVQYNTSYAPSPEWAVLSLPKRPVLPRCVTLRVALVSFHTLSYSYPCPQHCRTSYRERQHGTSDGALTAPAYAWVNRLRGASQNGFGSWSWKCIPQSILVLPTKVS